MRRWRVLSVFAGAALLAACTPQYITPGGPTTTPLRYRDAVFNAVTKTTNVTYGSAVDARGRTVTLQFDSYEPTGDTATKRPAIVWVHGGSFAIGDKSSPELLDEAQTFARKGYFNISINYRLEPGGCSTVTATCITAIREAADDAMTAVRFLRANAATYHIDTDRIAIGGSSAGAVTALNVAYAGDDAATPSGSTVQAAVSLSGAHLVVGKLDADDPPVFLMHGTLDSLVLYSWATTTVQQAHAAGLEAYLTTWEGEGHVPYAEHRQQILDQTRNFLYSALDLAHAQQ
jgi:dipeptidyl aminopeptidase/acylaminoacyl peptidase